MGKMFKTITRTWNPCKGCLHDCTYCWARPLAEKLKAQGVERYQDGFEPRLIEKELKRQFKPGEFVFVTDMGDLYGIWVPREWILPVIQVQRSFPDTNFLNQTKNPARFREFSFPCNAYLGTTIETNRDYKVTKAPEPKARYIEMKYQSHPHKFISIEPVMDFDLDILVGWVIDINPEIVEIGADNYHNNLPEPNGAKIRNLIVRLRDSGITVIEKDGLGRLLGE